MTKNTAYKKVCLTTDLKPGEKIRVPYDNEDVGVFNIQGEYFAISDICTHDYGPLIDGKLEGEYIICPRHFARFNVKTGKHTLPAYEDIQTFEVKIIGKEIWIRPKQKDATN